MQNYLQNTKDIYPLVTFRILFGALIAFGAIRTWSNAWIEKLYVEPDFFFKFYGFDWVKHPGETGIYILFALIIFSAIGVMLGLFYRLSILTFFICFTYKELIDATNYLNHYYLVVLLAFLMIFLPANRFFSLDVQWRGTKPMQEIPSIYIDVLILQLTLVYTFAGIAKLNTDWLVHAMPLRIWLPEHQDLPILGYFFQQKWCAFLFCWGGAIYDLTIAYFLMWRKSRPIAYILVIIFHAMTYLLFNIGLFPLIMIFSTLIFFSDKWHSKFYKKISDELCVPLRSSVIQKSLIIFIPFFTLQILLPLRHHLYRGNVIWTEEGYRFSWRVMLAEKSGQAIFTVTNPQNGQKAEILNSQYLTPYQEKQMAIQPDFILQFAHHLAEEYQLYHGVKNPIVTVESFVAINARPSQRFVQKNVDLSKEKDTFEAKKWIVPFREN